MTAGTSARPSVSAAASPAATIRPGSTPAAWRSAARPSSRVRSTTAIDPAPPSSSALFTRSRGRASGLFGTPPIDHVTHLVVENFALGRDQVDFAARAIDLKLASRGTVRRHRLDPRWVDLPRLEHREAGQALGRHGSDVHPVEAGERGQVLLQRPDEGLEARRLAREHHLARARARLRQRRRSRGPRRDAVRPGPGDRDALVLLPRLEQPDADDDDREEGHGDQDLDEREALAPRAAGRGPRSS